MQVLIERGPGIEIVRWRPFAARDRRMLTRTIALAITAIAACTPVQAQKLVPADPWEVIHIAREHGRASVTKDKLRDPIILAEAGGLKYGIEFYGCRLGRDCVTILFRTRLFEGGRGARHISGNDLDDWNGTKLFGRAVLDDSGRPVLEHPVAMGPGLSQDTMRANFHAWVTALEQFADHVDLK